MELFAAIEYSLYTPNVMQGNTLATPTPYCFVMKVGIPGGGGMLR